tara:strand:+ start:7412 stop:8284 length:873 start_codon:yes stop_codon:yes gene_type:complete
MDFFIYLYSGLNNKLIPLISLLRIANKENKKIYCVWGEDAYCDKTIIQYHHLFEPIDNIIFIDKNKFVQEFNNSNNKIYNKNGSDRDRNEIIYSKNNTKSVFFRIVHAISYKDDNVIGNFVPYPRTTVYENNFIKEMRNNAKKFIPKKMIQNIVDETLTNFNKDQTIGLHIRTTDGGFTDIPKNEINPFINSLTNKYPTYKIYISCDNIETENDIINNFGNTIVKLDKPFGKSYEDKFNRFTYGTINAVCEMLILSKCNIFYGTPSSSFTFSTWLLRNDNELNFWCNNPW